MKKFFLSAFLIVLATSQVMGANKVELSLALKGRVQKSLSIEEMKKISPPVEIEVYEPHESKNVTYIAFKVQKIFDHIYGAKWPMNEEVLFTCVDGYQPSIPLKRFTENDAYLAYERKGQKSFTVNNRFQNEENVSLSPYYLIWDNKKSEALKELGANGWPYQIAKIDLVSFNDQFPSLSPPKGSTASQMSGFLAFRDHCLSCHTINGEGGAKAPELNYPTNVSEYFSDQFIEKWILAPRSIRYNSSMPSFSHLSGSGKMTKNLIAYLRVMKSNKIKPKN